jgi:hypothetical protein
MKARQLIGLGALGLATWIVGAEWIGDAPSAQAASSVIARGDAPSSEGQRAEGFAAMPEPSAGRAVGHEGGSRETMTMGPGRLVPAAPAMVREVAAR